MILRTIFILLFLPLLLLFNCTQKKQQAEKPNENSSQKIPVILDTDANNELDDQHALAYMLYSGGTFDVRGVTVNATNNGGDINEQYAEANRVMRLCKSDGLTPLFRGANGNFETIAPNLQQSDYDGAEAVEFIIREARESRAQKLVLIPVGKLTNIALALKKAPDIKEHIRIVWLGSNYPEPGEYNQENDVPAMNYIFNEQVPFEMVTVRYGKPDGTDAVRVTMDDISKNLPHCGLVANPVTGRHGNTFTCFGDYSVDLFSHAEMYGDPPSRALFDLVAVAIVKNPAWGKAQEIAAPVYTDGQWQERPGNERKIIVWGNFDKAAIVSDFYATMKDPVLISKVN